jgi:hypothetical protein
MAQRISITATGKQVLGNASRDRVGRLAVQITGTWVGSITFVGRIADGSALAAADDVAVSYYTPASDTLSATAITANGVYYPKSDGLLVSANVGTLTSGTIVVDVIPLEG